MKLFRDFRNDALSTKKYSSFLASALVEIVLVVIGILIAVSLNNWNEERKEKIALSNILNIVREDLLNDIQEIDTIIAYHRLEEPVFNKVLEDSITKEEYEQHSNYAFVILGYPDLSIDTRGSNLLGSFNANTGDLQDSLVTSIMEFYTKWLLEIELDEDIRAQDLTENYMAWKTKYPWWADYITQKDISGFIEYALHDPDYKNRVATHKFLTYDVVIPNLMIFKENAKDIIEKIKIWQEER